MTEHSMQLSNLPTGPPTSNTAAETLKTVSHPLHLFSAPGFHRVSGACDFPGYSNLPLIYTFISPYSEISTDLRVYTVEMIMIIIMMILMMR